MELAWVLTICCLHSEGLDRELQLLDANYSAYAQGWHCQSTESGRAGSEMHLRLPGQGRGRQKEGSWGGAGRVLACSGSSP